MGYKSEPQKRIEALSEKRDELNSQIHQEALNLQGKPVTWMHNGYPQDGYVLEIGGFAGHTRIKVRNIITCTEQWMSLPSIFAA